MVTAYLLFFLPGCPCKEVQGECGSDCHHFISETAKVTEKLSFMHEITELAKVKPGGLTAEPSHLNCCIILTGPGGVGHGRNPWASQHTPRGLSLQIVPGRSPSDVWRLTHGKGLLLRHWLLILRVNRRGTFVWVEILRWN